MLQQITRRQRLQVLFKYDDKDTSLPSQLSKLLEPHEMDLSSQEFDSASEGLFLSSVPDMETAEYDLLLQYLNIHEGLYQHCENLPFSQDTLVLPPAAKRPSSIEEHGCTYSCKASHYGNSAIQFYSPVSKVEKTGFILNILQVPLKNVLRTFLIVAPHMPLAPDLLDRTPYPNFPRLQATVVDAQPSIQRVVIEPKHIITHLSTYLRPPGTFHLPFKTLVICWALNRGRR